MSRESGPLSLMPPAEPSFSSDRWSRQPSSQPSPNRPTRRRLWTIRPLLRVRDWGLRRQVDHSGCCQATPQCVQLGCLVRRRRTGGLAPYRRSLHEQLPRAITLPPLGRDAGQTLQTSRDQRRLTQLLPRGPHLVVLLGGLIERAGTPVAPRDAGEGVATPQRRLEPGQL